MSAFRQAQQWAWRLYHVDENSKSTDIGLLLLRVTVAACLFYHHGGEKFYDFHTLASRPNLNPIGIGVVPSVVWAGFTDGICSLLVLVGLFSRYASILLLVTLNTVWWLMNNGLKRLLWMNVPAPAGRPGQIAQAGVHGAAQNLSQMAGLRPPMAVHTLPNYLNVVMYMLAFLVILIAGPGRYSLDKKLQTRKLKMRTARVAEAR